MIKFTIARLEQPLKAKEQFGNWSAKSRGLYTKIRRMLMFIPKVIIYIYSEWDIRGCIVLVSPLSIWYDVNIIDRIVEDLSISVVNDS